MVRIQHPDLPFYGKAEASLSMANKIGRPRRFGVLMHRAASFHVFVRRTLLAACDVQAVGFFQDFFESSRLVSAWIFPLSSGAFAFRLNKGYRL